MTHQGSTVVRSYNILHRYPEEQLRKHYGSVLPPNEEISFGSLLATFVNLEHNCAKKANLTDEDFDVAAKGSKISGARLKKFWQDFINHDAPPFFTDSDED
jgi:hypothetical protein